MTFAVLGLGSNKSWNGLEPLQLLVRAVCELKALFVSDFTFSSVYVSKAMYYEDQADFHNMCAAGFTELTPYELLEKIHGIEAGLGRNRKTEIRNGPRSIDIDIELFGKEKITFFDSDNPMKNLEIPHPRLKERAFVLIPMLEILKKNAEILKADIFAESLSETSDQGVEKLIDFSCFCQLVKDAEVEYGKSGKCPSTDFNSGRKF